MQLLSTTEAVEVTGIHPQAIRNWLKEGLFVPEHKGSLGRCNPHGYSLVQVIALATGQRYRQEGATDQRCREVVRYLANMKLEHLEAALAEGKTFPVPGTIINGQYIPGMMVVPPPPESVSVSAANVLKRIDLQGVYDEVMEKVNKLKSKELAAKS